MAKLGYIKPLEIYNRGAENLHYELGCGPMTPYAQEVQNSHIPKLITGDIQWWNLIKCFYC